EEERALAVVRAYLSRKVGDVAFKQLQASLLLSLGKTEESKQEFLQLAKTSKEYTSFTDHITVARAEKDAEFGRMFEGMDRKIQERTRRVLELRKKRAESKTASAA